MKERKESQKGASAVEFALVFPVLLLLILAIIEFSFFLFNRAVITNAAREGARAGIVQRSPSEGRVPFSEIETKVRNYSFNHLITFGGQTTPNVDTKIVNDSGVVISDPDPPCPTGAYSATNLRVTATFYYTYLVLPYFGTTMKAEAVMKCE